MSKKIDTTKLSKEELHELNKISFSNLTKEVNPSSATSFNDGKVDIAKDANDDEAFSTAVAQNAGVALTDPYLTRDGEYWLWAYPNKKTPVMGLRCKLGKDNWAYWPWAHPEAHKMFMQEVEDQHQMYAQAERKNEVFKGVEYAVPPYIGIFVSMKVEEPAGGPEWCKYIVKHYPKFWIDQKTKELYK